RRHRARWLRPRNVGEVMSSGKFGAVSNNVPLDDLYLLEVVPEWRFGRGRYWRRDARGYTDLLENAGVYTATEVVKHASSCTKPVSLRDVLLEHQCSVDVLMSEALIALRRST